MEFICDYLILFQLIQSQCNIVICKITNEMEHLHVRTLEAHIICHFYQT